MKEKAQAVRLSVYSSEHLNEAVQVAAQRQMTRRRTAQRIAVNIAKLPELLGRSQYQPR